MRIIDFNKIVKTLILSDLALLSGLGLVSPIFALYLTSRIEGGSLEVAGYAAAVYWIVNSLCLIPMGRYLDRNHGEKDDLFFIVVGNFLAALVMVGYMFARWPWHIYALQGLYAFGMAMNIPGYTAIFTRHVDKGAEASSWGARGASIGLGAGIAGAVGGIIAHRFGFNTLFAAALCFVLLSAMVPFLIRRNVSPRSAKMPPIIPQKRV